MLKRKLLVICSIASITFSLLGPAQEISKNKVQEIKEAKRSSKKEIAKKILGHFDSCFYKLPFRKQGHYALRRYRTTGNSDFLVPALHELYVAADRLSDLSRGVKNKVYRYDKLWKEVNSEMLGLNKVRAVLRKESIKKHPDHVFFAHLLLPELNRVNEFGMQLKNDTEKLRQTLSGFDFKPGFNDPDMIRAWASRQSNQVYWLYNMGLGDYRGAYMDAFRLVYPDNKDLLLSDQQYTTKITGMAHLIIAASSYYQEPVNDTSLEWVTNYFQKNIDIILSRARDGSIAEVGVSLMLTGKVNSPAVEKVRRRLIASYDEKYQMIPGTDGCLDFVYTQHRNLLAGIFLGWSGSYFPGPYLYKMKQFSGKMPSVLEREHGY